MLMGFFKKKKELDIGLLINKNIYCRLCIIIIYLLLFFCHAMFNIKL